MSLPLFSNQHHTGIRALVMGDGVPCYGALEIVGLLLLFYYYGDLMVLRTRTFTFDDVVLHCPGQVPFRSTCYQPRVHCQLDYTWAVRPVPEQTKDNISLGLPSGAFVTVLGCI